MAQQRPTYAMAQLMEKFHMKADETQKHA